MRYEYKVVPAPAKPRKGPRIKGAEAKFAYGLETVMNEYASDGWEYQRADILPSEERRGLRSSQTVYRTVLVFRRAIGEANAPAPSLPTQAPVDATTPSHRNDTGDGMPDRHVEEVRETERRARFSLVGPARRDAEGTAPPLSAPHIGEDSLSDTDPSDERR